MFSDLRYGVAFTFEAPVIKAGSDDFAASADWTPAAGDVLVSLDGGAAANITTLPAFISGANYLQWTLSAAEMSASRISIIVVDAAAKAIKDQSFTLFTEAHNRQVVTIAGTPTATSMDTDATDSTGLHDNSILKFISGTLKGAQGVISTYTQTNGNFAFAAGEFPSAPAVGDKAIIINR